jgi:hypothetical protein
MRSSMVSSASGWDPCFWRFQFNSSLSSPCNGNTWNRLRNACCNEPSVLMPFNGMWRSRDRSVGTATSYGLDNSGYIPGRGKIFSSAHDPVRLWSTPTILSNGCRGVELPGREADHSPPSGAEVKNGGAIPLHPLMSSWHNALPIKHRDTLIFLP